MKLHYCVIGLLLFTLATARSAELEARLFYYSGDPTSADELIRLNESGLLPLQASCVVPIDAQGNFGHKATKPLDFPLEFDSRGRPIKMTSRDIGFWLNGHAKALAGNFYEIAFTVKKVDFDHLVIVQSSDLKTPAIPSPSLQTLETSAGITSEVNSWMSTQIPLPGKDRCVILVKVRP